MLKTVFYVSSSLMLQMLKILNRIGCPVFFGSSEVGFKVIIDNFRILFENSMAVFL
jgi:hypothetical protein